MSFEFREYVFIVRQHRAATAPESPLDLNQYWWFGKMRKKNMDSIASTISQKFDVRFPLLVSVSSCWIKIKNSTSGLLLSQLSR